MRRVVTSTSAQGFLQRPPASSERSRGGRAPDEPGRHEEGDAVDQSGLRERSAELPAPFDEHRDHVQRAERVEERAQVHASGVARQLEHAHAPGPQGR